MTAQTPPSVDPTTLAMISALLESEDVMVPAPIATRLFVASRAIANDAETRMEFSETYLGYLASFVVKADPLPIGQHDAERVGDVMGGGDWWSAHMLRLIARSDPPHRERLRLAFPSHVEAYERWCEGLEATFEVDRAELFQIVPDPVGDPCPECNGTGIVHEFGGQGSCESCGGNGRVDV